MLVLTENILKQEYAAKNKGKCQRRLYLLEHQLRLLFFSSMKFALTMCFSLSVIFFLVSYLQTIYLSN